MFSIFTILGYFYPALKTLTVTMFFIKTLPVIFNVLNVFIGKVLCGICSPFNTLPWHDVMVVPLKPRQHETILLCATKSCTTRSFRKKFTKLVAQE